MYCAGLHAGSPTLTGDLFWFEITMGLGLETGDKNYGPPCL